MIPKLYFLKFLSWIAHIKEIYNHYFHGTLVANWKWKFTITAVKKIIYKNRILLTWIGNASTSSFSVVCLDWRDEGIYAERSGTRDPTLNEPLVYEYVAYIPETDGSTKYYQSAVPIFRGSEYLIMLTY